MKVFYDSEFVERGPQLPIQPVSFGFTREDGAELYLINEECLSNVMKHPWCSVNVRPGLPIKEDGPYIFSWDDKHPEYPYVFGLDALIQQVHMFLTETPDLELWAYYGAYDHVVLCQLFGSMGELPAGIPMFTHDLQWLVEQHPRVKLPPEPEEAHHAMWDARWVRDSYQKIAADTAVAKVRANVEDAVVVEEA
jgi:hypothetical protein